MKNRINLGFKPISDFTVDQHVTEVNVMQPRMIN